MSTTVPGLHPLIDYHPETTSIRDEVLDGLQQTPKQLPSKLFYDARGSRLFDRICELPEYYPTRTEMGIMQRHVDAMAARIGARAMLVEFGSGSSRKTRILLDRLDDLVGYVPIDISKEHLLQSAEDLAEAYPALTIVPVCADYTTTFELPDLGAERTTVYFPGSTIGNFEPDAARDFLRRIAAIEGAGGGLLIGVDLQKDVATLEAAYNDAQGVTAAFNKNVLARINRELDGTFDLDRFRHRAFYDADEGRIEMHLVSLADQRVVVDGVDIQFDAGETICTEYSYKYSLDGFAELAGAAGFAVAEVWTDADDLFSVQYLVAQ
ncbi:MAG: L-histidine N(alpha)-methyltransferase [Bacteroidetes bacterium]|jgi:dimethylhistidine N-methyltransferase|nr:L-histidine N(alpha)-methyltransferase [Bacteroidota bacterium]